MKKLSYFLSLAVLGGMVVLSSCKKTTDPTPDANPTAKVYQSVITSNNGGNSGTANVTANVTTADGTAKIRLNVTSVSNIDHIYVLLSQDNGPLQPVSQSTITDSLGNTFTGGSTDFTFSSSNIKNFVLDVPVNIRTSTSAVSDVYYIWFTNGAGSFLKPTKNFILGPAVVKLNYTTAASSAVSYSSGTTTLGDQTASSGSLLVTSGQVSALLTSDYNDAPASADLALVALNAAGTTKTNESDILFLVSPSLRPTLGAFPSEPATGQNVTYIESYSGSFDSASGSDLSALSVSNTSLATTAIAAGNVYKFQTTKGKKGLLKVNSITTAGTGATANVSIKVLN